ncbi:uncharacterized protein LOC143253347 isoform X2 [Tachypleus tridentatus]|uniref:uncharacterized protein LOC143253347 isoform X2 n=1 Tax=Tachypleus tridentatus TaxID=6853 RepID=UPI003FD57330
MNIGIGHNSITPPRLKMRACLVYRHFEPATLRLGVKCLKHLAIPGRTICKTNPLKSETVDARHHCEGLCRTPCRKVTYEVSHYKEPIIVPNTVDEKKALLLFKRFLKKPVSLEFIKSNSLKVIILMKNKELKIYQHHPRYQDVELFSYIGGYLGIWLGISLASILDEIIQSSVTLKNWFINLKQQSSKAIEPTQHVVDITDSTEQ